MTGVTTYQTEKGDSAALMTEIVSVFTSAGSTSWFSQQGATWDDSSSHAILLQSTSAVDPILAELNTRPDTDTQQPPTPDQSYRLLFWGAKDGSGNITEFRVYWGTQPQLPNAALGDLTKVDPDTPFITLWDATCFPQITSTIFNIYSYRITIVPRGFVFAMWKNDQPNDLLPGNSLLVIQRPVVPGGAGAGQYRDTGRIPIFALDVQSGRSVGEEVWFSVVREEDINSALRAKLPIGTPTTNNLYGINLSWNHPNILSNFTHVIRVPFGLATDRNLYMEEMDLVAMTQATSFILDQVATLNMYSQAREYTAVFGVVDYGYADTQKILGGVRLNILTSIDKTNPTGPNFITVV